MTFPTILACRTSGDAHAYMAQTAAHLLREREAKYPAAVTAGQMTAEQAASGLELMRVVVAQWRWATDAARGAAPQYDHAIGGRFGAMNRTLVAELHRVADLARERAGRDPVNHRRGVMADLCDALAWYQQDHCGEPRIVLHMLPREPHAVAAAA